MPFMRKYKWQRCNQDRNFPNRKYKKGKFLGIQSENNLPFDYHLTKICRKASRKLYVPGRESPYMNLSKRKILTNAGLLWLNPRAQGKHPTSPLSWVAA